MADTAEKHLVYCWIERDGAVLFPRRQPETFLGGRWELPGGTVEPGELPEVAVVREIAEETGLPVRVTAERGRHTWPDIAGKALRIHARVYEVTEHGRPAVVLNPGEHDDFGWLTPAQAAELDLPAHLGETLAKAR
ncbi:NUDIX hydrolase [Amycolatopsis sp. H20-H5]|uniref:NUDIX hydrolase n=1 Tax=Amycolatopsis sp. H20-H5 TaxID=3046309 RepID=UPI002DBDBA12|nr:NUDIX hydrolase [Amycolatopsis sp. H20-H5]MEC3981406.1 NUDIX hydrolase [Amycolatopsis sp. H20-H5]